ncbi:restriction endonuclease subunit S [Volucribacter amazonae]|uniref:Restriction endonuclease subunit S n=1 Tax=Volucribacter amazonae TaxID=256731 RepID=A0A9X4SQH7_9PAST|nr:restriction endonuclease subunit S [Volucribacter amazonae]MDG6895346.1 restriction endonuclease subunit S [Volucribacter amazonae]
MKLDTLKNISALIVDCPHSTPKWTTSGYTVLRNQGIKNGKLILENCSYTDEENFKHRIKRAKPKFGDIVITREAPMGEVCKIPKNLECCLGQRQVLIRPMENIDSDYLLYALLSPKVQNQISWNEGTGSTVSNLRIPVLESLLIPRLGKHNEKKVANILKTLDDKIHLNSQTNQTLEALAQAIFKHWFIDFAPVHAKADALAAGKTAEQAELAAMASISGKTEAEVIKLANSNPQAYQQLQQTAAAFPSEFVESEMGLVPKGWEVKKIDEVIQKIPVGKKYSQKTTIPDGKVPVLDQGKSGIIGYHNDEAGVTASIENPVIVFANHTCYMRLIHFDFSAIQNVFAFKGKKLNIYWLYLATLGKQEFVEYKGHFPDFLIKEVIVPNESLTEVFGKLVKNNFSKIAQNTQENQTLAQARDTLLPKLLSGEIEL